jgi:hypothetical protein
MVAVSDISVEEAPTALDTLLVAMKGYAPTGGQV